MFGFSLTHLLLFGIIGLIFIGPKQLPEVARTLARFLREIRSFSDDFTGAISRLADECQRDRPTNQSSDQISDQSSAQHAVSTSAQSEDLKPTSISESPSAPTLEGTVGSPTEATKSAIAVNTAISPAAAASSSIATSGASAPTISSSTSGSTANASASNSNKPPSFPLNPENKPSVSTTNFDLPKTDQESLAPENSVPTSRPKRDLGDKT